MDHHQGVYSRLIIPPFLGEVLGDGHRVTNVDVLFKAKNHLGSSFPSALFPLGRGGEGRERETCWQPGENSLEWSRSTG